MSENNNNNNENILPKWITQIFVKGNMPCGKCKEDLTAADISSLGIVCSNYLSDLHVGPKANLEVVCDGCGQITRITLGADLGDVLNAIESFHDYIVQVRMEQKPPSASYFMTEKDPKVPKPKKEDNDKEDGNRLTGYISDDGEENYIEEAFRRRRRHYRRKLIKKPTDREVEIFKRRLEKTSFKRSSKGFREFMASLGIDIDKPVDDEGGEA